MRVLKTLLVIVNNSQFINIKNDIDSHYNNEDSKKELYSYIKDVV
jgi:hypothetical protein